MKYRRSILPRSSAPCHNGSESCIFLSLRKPRNRPTPARGTSRGTPVLRPSVPCHNGSGSCIFLPLRKYRNRPSPARGTSRPPPLATTAANPAFSCHCGSPGAGQSCERLLSGHFAPPSLATTAANPAFSCRCGCPGAGLSPRETPLGPLRSYALRHNGSESRIFLPLRMPTAA